MLPLDFSARLFTITHIGTPVIIAAGADAPKDIVHPGLVLAADADAELTDAVRKLSEKSHPSDWPEGTNNAITSVIVSGADKSIQILEDSAIVASGTATIQNPDQPLGSHVFVLSGAGDDGKALHWMGIAYDHDSETVSAPSDLSVIKRVNGPKSVVKAMKARMHPGMVLVFTDLPANPDTRTGEDFVVMDDSDA